MPKFKISNKFITAGIIFYLLPVLPYLVYIINLFFIGIKPLLFWHIFLISFAPLTLLGLVSFIVFLFKKEKNKKEKRIAFAGIIYGILALLFVIFVVILLFIVLKSF